MAKTSCTDPSVARGRARLRFSRAARSRTIAANGFGLGLGTGIAIVTVFVEGRLDLRAERLTFGGDGLTDEALER